MVQITIEKTPKYLIFKIPLQSFEEGKAELTPRAQKIIDRAIAAGLRDIEGDRVFGPFSNIKEFKKAPRK